MIFPSKSQVRLTPSELRALRHAAARNGVHVGRVTTPGALLQATLDGLPADRVDEMLDFIESRCSQGSNTSNGTNA